jgi:hypothetical protein
MFSGKLFPAQYYTFIYEASLSINYNGALIFRIAGGSIGVRAL